MDTFIRLVILFCYFIVIVVSIFPAIMAISGFISGGMSDRVAKLNDEIMRTAKPFLYIGLSVSMLYMMHYYLPAIA